MKKNDYLVLALTIFTILISIVNMFFGFLNNYLICVYLVCFLIVSVRLLGFHKNKSIIQKDVILSILIRLLSYYIFIYLLGLFIGFVKNIYNLSLLSIIKNTFPLVLIIILQEFSRYVLLDRAKLRKKLIIFIIFSIVLLSNTINISNMIAGNSSGLQIVKQLGLFIIPSFTSNVFLTYMSFRVGYKPCIIYRFLMELPIYLIPIYPAFGDYIDSIIKITIPVVLLIWLYRVIESKKVVKVLIIKKDKLFSVFRIFVILFSIVIVYLVSCKFTYKAFVIASGSMQPKIHIGDVVVVKEMSEKDIKNIRKGDVIAYKSNGVIICHSVNNIIQSGNETLYEFKGINNPSVDQLLVSKNQLVGKLQFIVKYVGYPTVVLNKLGKE